MKNLSLLLALLLVSTSSLLAQDNVAKFGLFNLLFRTVNVEYERVINDNQSVAIQAGVFLPWNNPGGIVESAELEGIALQQVSMNGFNLTPQYRFYLSQKGAPAGFYIAPYLNLNTVSLRSDFVTTVSDGTQSEQVDATATLRWLGLGGGVQLGAQWIISDAFVIDWYFAGLTVRASRISADIDLETDLEVFTLEDFQDEIEQGFGDVPLFGDRVITNTEGNRVRISTGYPGLGFRTGLSIGYAF